MRFEMIQGVLRSSGMNPVACCGEESQSSPESSQNLYLAVFHDAFVVFWGRLRSSGVNPAEFRGEPCVVLAWILRDSPEWS